MRFLEETTIKTGVELEQFFAGYSDSRIIFDRVIAAAASLGPVDMRVSKSQVALAEEKPFAWLWIPARHLHRAAAPLVLTLSFRERRTWHRWKEIYQAAPGRFTHHLELWTAEEVDDDVRDWLRQALEAARERGRSSQPRHPSERDD